MDDKQLKDLWRDQPMPSIEFSVNELRKQASTFQRRVAWRNRIEYLAGVIVTLVFVSYLWHFPYPLMRLGSVLIIFACPFVLTQLHRRASSRLLPDDMAKLSCLEFHRQQLIRQRDALRSVWLWYVAPFVPGVAIFRWGVETELDAAAPFSRGLWANLWIVGILLVVVLLNLRAANKLQRKIDALEREGMELK